MRGYKSDAWGGAIEEMQEPTFQEVGLASTVRELHGQTVRCVQRMEDELRRGDLSEGNKRILRVEIERGKTSLARLEAALGGWEAIYTHLCAIYEGRELADRLCRGRALALDNRDQDAYERDLQDMAHELGRASALQDRRYLALSRPVLWFLEPLWQQFDSLTDRSFTIDEFFTMVLLLVMYGSRRLLRNEHTRRGLWPLLDAIHTCETNEWSLFGRSA